MPGERLAVRDASEVGRFPGVAPPTRVELTIHKEGEKKEEEGGCRRWLRKAFPCCCQRQNSASLDVTDRVELVAPPTPPLLPEPPKSTPENGELKEMEEMKLSVCSVDLLSSKTGQNRAEHHTDMYHGDELIVRRGQSFQIEVEFNRPFDTDTDKLHLDMRTGTDATHVRSSNQLMLQRVFRPPEENS
eukprot:XP_011618379.1 PREDICTED: protein-glutamine gamma-glutamyltransferase K [Takifugu rubripes]